jgi:2-C-methyl-D-erythritol 4-phosphate cytidylyltransferase
MIEWSIGALRACESVGSIVVACPPGHVHGLGGDDLGVVPGGATRSRSVANALEAVDTELVAIHDAARPLLTPGLVEAVVAGLVADPGAAGAIAAAPVTDTVKRAATANTDSANQARRTTRAAFASYAEANAALVVERTLDRSTLWAAQTPQVFRAAALREALAAPARERDAATDEAMLVEAAGGKVLIHPFAGPNLKVTTPLDLKIAELVLTERRTGAPGLSP